MKKIITFIFCMCLLPLAGKAQESLETATMRISDDCSYQVIVPTVGNLLSIVNMDVATFKATMSRYHYHPDEQLSGSSYRCSASTRRALVTSSTTPRLSRSGT